MPTEELIHALSQKIKAPTGEAGGQPRPPAGVDLERLAERIVEKLRETLALENERTGRI